MKKYSIDYFEKKYEILFNKLLIKNRFVNEVKEIRKTLGIPVENGFVDQLELAEYLRKKLTKKEEKKITMFSYIERYDIENKTRLTDSVNDKEKFFQHLVNKGKKQNDPVAIGSYLLAIIDDHSDLFTSHFILKENKFISKLSPIVFKLMNKYWGFDLLDEHIAVHFIESYLFLGEYGVRQYIKNKLACPHCRYIGVVHFSPTGLNMSGRKKGIFSKKYLFNEATIKLLSSHFNSVFLIIKPYATKEQVLQYIEDNWNDLKEHLIEKNAFYKQFDVHPSKIKDSDFERNQLIYELYKLPKKELLKTYKGKKDLSISGIYKETVISAILEEQHKIDISPDAIKKSATRFAKSTNTKKKMKDIEDI